HVCLPRYLHSFPTRRSSDLEYSIGEGTLAIACVGEQWRPSNQGTSAALEVENLEDAITRLEERKISYDKVDSPVCRMAIIEDPRSEEHTSELQSHLNLVCRL